MITIAQILNRRMDFVFEYYAAHSKCNILYEAEYECNEPMFVSSLLHEEFPTRDSNDFVMRPTTQNRKIVTNKQTRRVIKNQLP